MTVAAGESLIDLTITLTEYPGAGDHILRFVADGGSPGPASTVPDPGAALTVLEIHGEGIFFPRPGPPRRCTQQYGGPQVAIVTGQFKGRRVNCRFQLTDGCEIARWRALAPLLGTGAGSGTESRLQN
ncbi:serine protease inhibitor [Arthrobacter sp. H14-L1]|uniref:serine protease inhibitor n=1 Tax=Arthrobacter sp. H14-L1 TaxID=2996697 RepID=UPI00226E7B25|nr:serine protease inhibitor [Arthrobacter sp. H14-L1]MCY0904384.1 serine protease inhibitor [Arthrobacter sp. H14-L1]